jgi:TonB family protein
VLKLIEPKPPATTAPPVDNIVTKSEPLPTPELKVQMPPADLAKSTPATRPVSVGRFGDSNGVPPASSKPNAVMLAKVGSFDSPNGFGQSGAGGHNQSGAVRESGFGAVSAANGRSVENGPVHTGAFNDSISAPPQNSRSKTAEVSAPMVTPVEILFKPKPAYTMEARNLRLEGQVSLQVIFLSTGSVRVVRVVHGLGHGLDEAAQQAAAQVRFKPATRGGVPVDTNATINITFELT